MALAPHTTLRVGGPARYLVEAQTEDDVVRALELAHRRGLPVRVLGGGSNLLIADAGFDGLVLAMAIGGLSFSSTGDGAVLSAGAGVPWDHVVGQAVQRGLSGLEGLSGIPGRTGATPIQNVGAYGQEVAETISSVRVLDRSSLEISELDARGCRFGYRDSFFKSEAPERYVVTAVRFTLSAGAPRPATYPDLQRELARRQLAEPSVSELRQCVLAVRAEKSMLLDANDPNGRSCGSFFLNPIVTASDLARVQSVAGSLSVPAYPQADGRMKLAAAWLIEQSGFGKGLRDGAVGLSTKHALAIVAHDGATAEDVRRLAQRIQSGVRVRFGVELAPEPNFWGF